MKRTIILISILLSFSMWECSKVDTDFSELSLKESLEKNVAEINDAVVKISGSKGFQLISSAGEDIKSDYTFRDSITLKLIAGIYDYQPDSVLRHNNFFPYKLFRKSAPGSQLIVNLPEKLVYHPKNLHFFTRSNLNLNNNFKITASDRKSVV